MTAADLARRLSELRFDPTLGTAFLAEHIAALHGSSLRGVGLRLLDEVEPVFDNALPKEFVLPEELTSPDVLGEVYERMLTQAVRHESGVHYTPRSVADGLVAAAAHGWVRADDKSLRILDPSAGGGAFLLAAARWRFHDGSRGHSRVEVCRELLGRDVNPVSVMIAEAALALWCIEGGESPVPLPGLSVGDLFVDELPAADLVVGNPPFLNQLEASTAQTPDVRAAVRERFAIALGPYADTASVFLVACLDALSADGRMVLIQPVSFLASRDVASVRERLSSVGQLRGLWFSDEALFEASVRVCAPIVATDEAGGETSGSLRSETAVERWVGAEVAAVASTAHPTGSSWGPIIADLVGVPLPTILLRRSAPRLIGDLAAATAGFRDQFYGFAPLCTEDAAGEETSPDDESDEVTDRSIRDLPAVGHAHLVTTGMIDPLRNRWGTTSFRFAKQVWSRPVVPLDELRRTDPDLALWTEARLRPKLLVATQTKVLETAVDVRGTWIPVTPLIALEPFDAADDGILWQLAAVLSAPALSALSIAEHFGAALMVQAIKLSAGQVLSLPLPSDDGAWREGTQAAQRACQAATAAGHAAAMQDLGVAMTAAYGSSEETLRWWNSRLPAPDRK